MVEQRLHMPDTTPAPEMKSYLFCGRFDGF